MSYCMSDAGLQADNDGGYGLPLFSDMESSSPFQRSVDTRFEDPLIRELVRSRPVQRLRRIGFLGAVDRIQSRNRHNRHDHSAGVARLALLYAKNRDLSRHDTRLLAVAGLLHDVGHGPLSHTLEPIFKSRFGISHHKAGSDIIRGESSFGREIPDLLVRYGLDPDEVNAMIDGTHHGQHAFLFSSPINLDTIDGVTRCRAFVLHKRPEPISATAIVRAISTADALPTGTFDSFWRLKHDMYNLVIHHRAGLLYDGLAQALVTQDIANFAPCDFLKDEPQLRRRKRALFKFLDRARRLPGTLRKELPDSILSHEIDAPTRTFSCDQSVELKTSTDLVSRYSQTATFRRVSIDDLLPAKDSTNCHCRMIQKEFSMPVSTALRVASKQCEKPPRSDSAMTPIS